MNPFLLNIDEIIDKVVPHPGPLGNCEYKRYLILRAIRPDLLLPPPPIIDQIWHEHILETAKYASDCQDVFGYFLHHTSNELYSEYSAQK